MHFSLGQKRRRPPNTVGGVFLSNNEKFTLTYPVGFTTFLYFEKTVFSLDFLLDYNYIKANTKRVI